MTFVLMCGLMSIMFGDQMVVRVHADSWIRLRQVSDKMNLDIAGARPGAWYDLVVDREGMDRVIASGLAYEVTIPSLELEKERYRGTYLSYVEINDSLRVLAANYPAICRVESLPYKTYLNRWIYGVKISDNVHLDEDEPGFALDGCHHSREWATPQAVLFFADSMLRSYGGIPEIAEIVNTTQIYCFPLINVDGYVHDYTGGQLSWRKNREPFGGYTGTDCNRNYSGACNGDAAGCWGAQDEGEVSHHPNSETFCGAYGFSGNEVDAYAAFIREHNITTGFSLHSYGEQVMWPWGYQAAGTPDASLYQTKGNYMAGLMQCLGGGTYQPGQSYTNPYPTVGNARDWVYGYHHYVNGISALFYGAEIGTAFYQPEGDLDFISRQVFKSAKYLAGFADSLILVTDGAVAPPVIYSLGEVPGDFTLYWHPRNAYDNHPTHWELIELSELEVKTDSLEGGTDRWTLQGFTLSTTYSHSSSHSLFSGNTAEQNTVAQTRYPYSVHDGDSLTFWCYYNLESNYDVAVVEASENNREWFNLDTMRFNGTQTSWQRKAFSLAAWSGKSIYFRFRCMYDSGVQSGGFYVDDIRPVCRYGTVDTISSAIVDTQYAFVGHPAGEYWYLVRGSNSAWGWGEYSCLALATCIGVQEGQARGAMARLLTVVPGVCHGEVRISCTIPRFKHARLAVYDAAGVLVRDLGVVRGEGSGATRLTWDGRDDRGQRVATGIYYVRLGGEMGSSVEKVVLVR